MKLFTKPRPTAAEVSDISAWRPDSAPVRVLLIDDDDEEAILLRGHLDAIAGADFELDWASSYSEGLAALARNAHDVCVVDYRLGAMDGVELVREARARGWRKPMVMMTSQRDRAVDLAATEAGANDFLVKGQTDPVLLERTLRYAVSLGDAMDALQQSHDQLAALDELGRVLAEEGPTTDALQHVLTAVARAFRHDRASLYVMDDEHLTLAAAVGYEHASPTIDPATARLARVVHGGRPTFVPNQTVPADWRSTNDPLELCVPMNAEGQTFGILNVDADPRLGTDEYRGIVAVADRIAVALALNRALSSRSVLSANASLGSREPL